MFTGKQLVWIHETAGYVYEMLRQEIQGGSEEEVEVALNSMWSAASILDDHPDYLPLDWVPDHEVHMWLYGVTHVSAEILREAIAESDDLEDKREYMDDYETCISIRRALFTVH